MTDSDPESPSDPDALYDCATDTDVDPYRREAAIKRLAQHEALESLTALAKGDAIPRIEQDLASARRDALDQS